MHISSFLFSATAANFVSLAIIEFVGLSACLKMAHYSHLHRLTQEYTSLGGESRGILTISSDGYVGEVSIVTTRRGRFYRWDVRSMESGNVLATGECLSAKRAKRACLKAQSRAMKVDELLLPQGDTPVNTHYLPAIWGPKPGKSL